MSKSKHENKVKQDAVNSGRTNRRSSTMSPAMLFVIALLLVAMIVSLISGAFVFFNEKNNGKPTESDGVEGSLSSTGASADTNEQQMFKSFSFDHESYSQSIARVYDVDYNLADQSIFNQINDKIYNRVKDGGTLEEYNKDISNEIADLLKDDIFTEVNSEATDQSVVVQLNNKNYSAYCVCEFANDGFELNYQARFTATAYRQEKAVIDAEIYKVLAKVFGLDASEEDAVRIMEFARKELLPGSSNEVTFGQFDESKAQAPIIDCMVTNDNGENYYTLTVSHGYRFYGLQSTDSNNVQDLTENVGETAEQIESKSTN